MERRELIEWILIIAIIVAWWPWIFLGYSDNYFGAREFDLTQRDRTFFVKLGYAWVL